MQFISSFYDRKEGLSGVLDIMLTLNDLQWLADNSIISSRGYYS